MSDDLDVEVVPGESTKEQVARLADLTKRFGALHEFQVHNLKLWSNASLHSKCTIEYQPDIRKLFVTMNARLQSYDSLPLFTEELARSVKFLLGNDVRLAVKDATHPYLQATVVYGDFDDYPASPSESGVPNG